MNNTIRRGPDVFDLPEPIDSMANVAAYRQSLLKKINIEDAHGLDVALSDLHPSLNALDYRHQGVSVQWGLRGGRRLLGLQGGLGKTAIQCELMRQTHRHTGKPTLVVCPLGVRLQFVHVDGPRLGMDFQYVENDAQIASSRTPYLITNYERIINGSVTAHDLGGVTFDEGSVFADFGTKSSQVVMNTFHHVPFRFIATATPMRNRYLELLNYAQVLGIADTGQTRTRYFKRNSQKANELTLMDSMAEEFWLWLASWCLFLEKPSDLGPGFSDEKYILPEPEIEWIRLSSDQTRAFDHVDDWGQRSLILNPAGGVSRATEEKRASMPERVHMTKQLIETVAPESNWLIWHHLEDERRLIEREIPGVVSVYGSQDLDEKERRLLDFMDGKTKILSTKPSIAGQGCNLQHHCSHMIFTGIDYKFTGLLQAIWRLVRHGQKNRVKVYILFTEAEEDIANTVKRKWRDHLTMLTNTTSIIKEYGLTEEAMKAHLRRDIGMKREVAEGSLFRFVLNDCVEEMAMMAEGSIDASVTSIPFGNLYEYSANYNDFGHNQSNAAFWEQMEYMIREWYRVMKPGRMVAIHVKDRIQYGNVTGVGFPTIDPFSHDCVYTMRKYGFHLVAERFVSNDVVRENNQTYRLSYSEAMKDMTKMGCGSPEKLLFFRKPQTDKAKGYADNPVWKQKADDSSDGGYSLARWQLDASEYWHSSGNSLLMPEDLVGMDINAIYQWFRRYSEAMPYNYEYHVRLGEELAKVGRLPKEFMLFALNSPVPDKDNILSVHDYVRMNTLNAQQVRRGAEKHICPLPLDLIERCIELTSNPGEIVYDPFGGIGSTLYKAIEMGRIGWGSELNREYWGCGVRYCQEMEAKMAAPTLFDLAMYKMDVATGSKRRGAAKTTFVDYSETRKAAMEVAA